MNIKDRVNPWETKQGRQIWKTKSQFMSWLRGGLRKGLWMMHPLKLDYIKRNRKKVPLGRKTINNPEGLVWGAECSLCKNDFRLSDIQVDHRLGNMKLTEPEDIQEFTMSMIFVDPDKDLSLVCNSCHKIKSYAEKNELNFEEAKIIKEVIKIMKDKKDKVWLNTRGIPPESTQVKRREQITQQLKKESLHD